MNIFVDVESPELKKGLEEKWNPEGNQTPVITDNILLAKIIYTDTVSQTHFAVMSDREEVGEFRIFNPNTEQLKELEKIKKKFPWMKRKVKIKTEL